MVERPRFTGIVGQVVAGQRFPRLRMRIVGRFHPLCWKRDAIVGGVSAVRVL